MITHNSIGYGGRLGNQLFQLSALLGVAYKNNYIPSIPVEKNKQVKPNGCLDMFTGKWISYKLDLFDCFDIKINDNGDTIVENSYKEPHHHFDENIFNISDNTNIEGYFQSEKYFEHIKDIIRDTFAFKKEIKDIFFASFDNSGSIITSSCFIKLFAFIILCNILKLCLCDL